MDLFVAPFRVDVSPPIGHSCCGGWIKPIEGYDDPQEAIGLVILGAEAPVVVCAVDWTGILNSGNVMWRTGLAEAAHTTPERVAVQCVHQHNAPMACPDAQAIIDREGDLPAVVDMAFFRECIKKVQKAIEQALKAPQRVTHIGHGQGKVEKVASNRRFVGPNGTIQYWRGSSSKGSPMLRELPEGLIDPWLKTVAFFNGDNKVAALHYYATHPMSYYGDGRASSEFVGLARKRRQEQEPDCTHIYFTGCSGNVAAGKYNDGSKQARRDLTDRIFNGIVASEEALTREPIASAEWRSREILPPSRTILNAQELQKQISNKQNSVVDRNRPAYALAFVERIEKKIPIVLSSFSINDVTMLHLPGESFIEYQLRAQELAPNRFVATAAYGDGGPWYIPISEAYPQGGYEVTVAWCDPQVDPLITDGIKPLLLPS